MTKISIIIFAHFDSQAPINSNDHNSKKVYFMSIKG